MSTQVRHNPDMKYPNVSLRALLTSGGPYCGEPGRLPNVSSRALRRTPLYDDKPRPTFVGFDLLGMIARAGFIKTNNPGFQRRLGKALANAGGEAEVRDCLRGLAVSKTHPDDVYDGVMQIAGEREAGLMVTTYQQYLLANWDGLEQLWK